MTSRSFLAAALSLALLAAASLPHAVAGEACDHPPEPLLLAADDTEKAKILAGITAAEAEKNKDKIAAALAPMIERTSPDFVPFIKRGLESTDQDVVANAVRAAASHEMKEEEKRVRKLLDPKKKWKDGKVVGHVTAASIDYLARLNLGGEEAGILEDHLMPFYKDEQKMRRSWAPLMVSASLHYFGKLKYRKAVPYIVSDMLPKPAPDPASARDNPGAIPPQSFWDARGGLWSSGEEGWSRWALKEITEKEFRTAREWAAWVKANKKDFEK